MFRSLRTIILGLAIVGSWSAAGQSAAESYAEAAAVARGEMVRLLELEVESIATLTGIRAIDPAVLAAMREVPRHEFVPAELRPYSYRNHPLPLGHEQNIAAPLLVALMTHLVDPEADDVVFETGTGAGYHAAVLAGLVKRVYSVEVVEPLASQSAKLLKDQGYDNVITRTGDGYYGWPEHAPYDAILIKEALDHVPTPLLRQLKRGGRMVLPLGPPRGPQFLTVIHKGQDGETREERIMPVLFSPLQGGERL
ncbi:MAG: protein-L-isoaspartate(D-aspartate) O-methyltransferase [Geminicoccaceae bacterium]|nr:protein-L-isoaspartate(D-aspartate) O-methyltransferase [Geminicoccaceae bacterium]